MTIQEWRWIFADRLHSMLMKRNINQSEFAERMDLTEAMVSRYMTATCSPKMETMLKMCEVLGCGLQDLVV